VTRKWWPAQREGCAAVTEARIERPARIELEKQYTLLVWALCASGLIDRAPEVGKGEDLARRLDDQVSAGADLAGVSGPAGDELAVGGERDRLMSVSGEPRVGLPGRRVPGDLDHARGRPAPRAPDGRDRPVLCDANRFRGDALVDHCAAVAESGIWRPIGSEAHELRECGS
jgi:hypothetical protein